MITAPASVLLEWRKPRRLADRANALIRALHAIGTARGKAVLDYLVTDDPELLGRTLDEARELLEQTQLTLRMLEGHTYARRARDVANLSAALHARLAKAHADALAVLREVEKTLRFLLEEEDENFEIPEPAPAGAFEPAPPVRFQP